MISLSGVYSIYLVSVQVGCGVFVCWFKSAMFLVNYSIKQFLEHLHTQTGKGNCIAVMEHHLTATECHLPYEITQCYLLTDTSERTPPSPQPLRPVLDLPTPKG